MKNAPEIFIPKSVSLPEAEKIVLPNGLPVYLLSTEYQDITRVSFVWNAGAALQSKPFVASTTLNLLSEGSARYSAHEIAEKLDFVGSYFDVSIDRDYAVATFCSLEKFFAPTLEMMAEIVLHPAFPDHEVAIYTRKRMERLALERSKPATKARELFSQALFGPGHPYGISSPESAYLNLERTDIQAFYNDYYGADNCFAVCSLGSDTAQREALLALLSQMPSHNCKLRITNYEKIRSENYSFLKIDGAVQSVIRIGRILFARNHPDFVGMQVVATLLGGYFGSRLTQNLRERRGYTYGVTAAMVNLRETGYLAIATEVAAQATNDAVAQIWAEIERLKTELVPPDELENVRRSMLGEVMRILDGPFGVVDATIESIQIGCTGNYVGDFIREIEAVTPAKIQQLARRYLDREAFTTVIVGRK